MRRVLGIVVACAVLLGAGTAAAAEVALTIPSTGQEDSHGCASPSDLVCAGLILVCVLAAFSGEGPVTQLACRVL